MTYENLSGGFFAALYAAYEAGGELLEMQAVESQADHDAAVAAHLAEKERATAEIIAREVMPEMKHTANMIQIEKEKQKKIVLGTAGVAAAVLAGLALVS